MKKIDEKALETATLLKRRREAILAVWTKRALTEVPAATLQNRTALLNSLPKFLDDLEKALRSEDPAKELSSVEHEYARDHGKERASMPGYSLEQVILEYDLFRQVIICELESECTHLRSRERDIILHSIFLAVKSATVEFVQVKQTEEIERNAEIEQSNAHLQTANDTLHGERDLRESVIRLITHDLRNPLTAAKASAQLIARKPERVDAIPQLAVRVIQAMDRADRMIQDLLDASLIRAGKKLTVQFEETNLSHLCKQTWQEFSSIYGNRFILKLPKDEIIIEASPAELRRALENLINNAIKYGKPETEITLGLNANQNDVRLWVHNLGPILSPADQVNIFNSFSRTKAVEDKGIKGWGLGLAIVQGVADAHGGKASVQSDDQSGTTFFIDLPRL